MPRRALFVLEVPGPLDETALGEGDALADDPAGLGDEVGDVAVADVEADVVAGQAVLALDGRGPVDDADLGDLGERDQARGAGRAGGRERTRRPRTDSSSSR